MDSFDDKDPVWKLLGRAPQKKASPYFVRKVLRAVREEETREPAFSWLRALRWLAPLMACVALAIGVPLYSGKQGAATTTFASTSPETAAEFNEYFDSVADLDSLLASDDASNWVASQ